jgi:hypothetical protein
MQQLTKERSQRSDNFHSRIKRKQELMKSYREADQDYFKVKKEKFHNDLINLKLKKYMHK